MTSTLTRPLQSQLPPRSQMDDLELQQLVRSIQASPNRQDRVVRKQINLLMPEVTHRLQGAKGAFIRKWWGIPNIESIVAEAIQNRILEAIDSIDKYDPNKASFTTWVSKFLEFRIIDLIRYYKKDREISIDAPTSEDNSASKAGIEANKKQEEEEQAITQDWEQDEMATIVRKFIQEDPEGHLAATHIQNRPDVTFQKILLMRLEPKTWQAIADSFNIAAHSAINVFHDRNLRKYNSYFRTYLSEQWYR